MTQLLSEDHDGLTKREYFAAMAMQGLLPASNLDLSDDDRDEFDGQTVGYIIAKFAVEYADALIKQLEQGE